MTIKPLCYCFVDMQENLFRCFFNFIVPVAAGSEPLNLKLWVDCSTIVLLLLVIYLENMLYLFSFFPMPVAGGIWTLKLRIRHWLLNHCAIASSICKKTFSAVFQFIVSVAAGYEPWNLKSWVDCSTTVLLPLVIYLKIRFICFPFSQC